MRGAPGNANVSLRWNTPHPSRRCAPIHLLPQGEKGKAALPKFPRPRETLWHHAAGGGAGADPLGQFLARFGEGAIG
ncbi:hypothetical protein EN798_32905, partial [bacterium M00.F.Ca.ET.155.01.1.1]